MNVRLIAKTKLYIMKFRILSYYKCEMLCFLLIFMLRTITSDNIDFMMYETRVNNKGPNELFGEIGYWNEGDIPILNRKVVKGSRVTIREHPYVASIRRNIMHYSVATVLTKNLFVTVAHPLIGVPLDELGVVVGENYADRGASLLTVLLVIIHEAFDQYSLAADIALLRVYEDVFFRCSVKYIQLVHPLANLNKQRAFVTGWGRCDRTGAELCLPRSSKYTPGEKFDPMMRTVSFLISQPNKHCEEYKKKAVTLKAGMLCVGEAREAQQVTPCMAVPGAPMVVNGHLAGLLSWGFGCGYDNDLPLIYTSVQHFQPWLVHNIPIIRTITARNLTVLFEAKRAYHLTKWLILTRVVSPTPFEVPKKPMEMTKLDKILASLRGQVYDIRDYLYGGIHHTYKKKLYAKLRQQAYIKKIPTINITYHPLEPFLNGYFTLTTPNPTSHRTIGYGDQDSDSGYDDYIHK